MRQYLSKSTTGLRTDLYKFSPCLCVQAARQYHMVLVLTSQVLTCHSSETVDKLFTISHLKQKRELK